MDVAPLDEEIPDAAVEQASVPEFALVPILEHELVLIVDELLLIGVVGIDDILPVVKVEEVVRLYDHVFEVAIRPETVGHRLAEVIL